MDRIAAAQRTVDDLIEYWQYADTLLLFAYFEHSP